MYKAKFRIWIAMLLLSAMIFNASTIFATVKNIGGGISNVASNIFQGTSEHSIFMDVTEQSLIQKVEGYAKSGVKLTNSFAVDGSDIIIANSSDKVIDGYNKMSEQFYSPIVMAVPFGVYNEDTLYSFKKTKDSNSSSHTYLECNLYDLIVAMENGKTWEEIGLKKPFGDGTVKIAIPREGTENYEIICEFIKFVINGNSFNDFENASLNTRAKNVIDKCEKYDDAGQYVYSICEAGKKGVDACVILPEYAITSSYHVAGTSNKTYSYIVCYPTKTICAYYDMFIKNTLIDTSKARILKSLAQKKFISCVGLRNVDAQFEVFKADYFYYAPKFFVTVRKP